MRTWQTLPEIPQYNFDTFWGGGPCFDILFWKFDNYIQIDNDTLIDSETI